MFAHTFGKEFKLPQDLLSMLTFYPAWKVRLEKQGFRLGCPVALRTYPADRKRSEEEVHP